MKTEEEIAFENLKEGVKFAKERLEYHDKKMEEIRKRREEREKKAKKLHWYNFL